MLSHAFPRYLGASLLALGVDMGCYLLLLRLTLAAAPAAALSYALGIAAHWFLSSRAVFAQHLAQAGADRLRQQALFVASALLGLAVTVLIVGAGSRAGLDPRLAKGIAVAASFAATYSLRNRLVFAPRLAD
ncbi:GtrA family protein [Novosphingobium terrae]|uniref:GtrA family protein n=1 Tax=Novosphingobium terrae TaxID=2726189 RepID=UPI001F129BCD|nr:GtrA family protein [Novosphingobium terrae]